MNESASPYSPSSTSSHLSVAWLASLQCQPVTAQGMSHELGSFRAPARALSGDMSHTVHEGVPVSTNRKGPNGMARHQRLAEVALEQAEETHSALITALRAVDAAMGDDVVTVAEARRIRSLVAVALEEAQDVVTITEHTNVAELAAGALLTTGGIGPALSRRMRQCGMTDNLIQFPAPNGNHAA